jgi:hypothetical protein
MTKKVNFDKENYSSKSDDGWLIFAITLKIVLLILELADYKPIRSSITYYCNKFIAWLRRTKVYRKAKWLINEFLCWCNTKAFPMVKESYLETLWYFNKFI